MDKFITGLNLSHTQGIVKTYFPHLSSIAYCDTIDYAALSFVAEIVAMAQSKNINKPTEEDIIKILRQNGLKDIADNVTKQFKISTPTNADAKREKKD